MIRLRFRKIILPAVLGFIIIAISFIGAEHHHEDGLCHHGCLTCDFFLALGATLVMVAFTLTLLTEAWYAAPLPLMSIKGRLFYRARQTRSPPIVSF
ncbi:MAG: hypothetical protein GF307_09825 [candidate division Zixibacteria bacterium]|nr:hypothetical protein [candidate division Zixibacteria bacterium]